MAEIAEYVMPLVENAENYILKQYIYHNHALQWPAVLWRATSCDEPDSVDLIAFQSCSEVPEWHGSFQETAGGHIILKFNCKGQGPEHPLKRTVLYVVDRERSIYEGADYRGRDITLSLQRVADFDSARNVLTWRSSRHLHFNLDAMD